MRDLLEFLLAPFRRVPWSVVTVFSAVLGLILVVASAIRIPLPLGEATSLAACFAAGMVGASRGREFDHGILAVLVAIVLANVIGVPTIIATKSASALHIVPARFGGLRMLVLGLPVGTAGAAVGAWLSHRRSVNGSPSALPAAF